MTEMTREEARERVEKKGWKPRNAVWELTLACNLNCKHCGSSAGTARPDELSLDESLVVANDLADLGCELVTLSGGEPTLKKGWDTIARTLSDRGVLCNMVTNGVYGSRGRTQEIAGRIKDSGMTNLGISIDGPEHIHNRIRGKETFQDTVQAVKDFSDAGIRVGLLTTVNQLNYGHLEEVRSIAMDIGATMWRLQLAKPMGNLPDNDDWVIRPMQYLQLVPRLARLKKEGGIHLAVGDSIGYYGPHDKVLRGHGWRNRAECWHGCQAGMQAIGIEADGGIKGCLSLQAKWGDCDPFLEGNVRKTPLKQLWYQPGIFAFNRDANADDLTGYCGRCRHKALCRGGASCVASAFTQELTEDPYCWYRLASLDREKRRGEMARSAASAAAAVILTMGLTGCPESTAPGDAAVADTVNTQDGMSEPDFCCPEYGVQADLNPQPQDIQPDPDVQLEYGVPPDIQPQDIQPDPDVQLEYGVPPDIQPQDIQPDPDVQLEYGVPPDIQDAVPQPEVTLDYGIEPDIAVQPEYGVPADIVHQDAVQKDAIDCEAVCCDCEYGIIPEEVWEECCAPDPCENVCCECDYGDPPPPECCD